MRSETVPSETVNYKKKYQTLKKKLRLLVYEQECFIDELKKSQRKLLKVSRDRSFLLDRLLQYEHFEDSSSDSESTASSDSGNEMTKDASANKKRRLGTVHPLHTGGGASAASSSVPGAGCSAHLSSLAGAGSDLTPRGMLGRLPKEPPKKKPKVTVRKMQPKTAVPSKLIPVGMAAPPTKGLGSVLASILEHHPVSAVGTSSALTAGQSAPPRVVLSREEIERHLDLKHSAKPQFLSIETTPHSLPDDIFSHDNSNQDCTDPPLMENIKIEVDESDLVIDMA